MTTPAEAPRTLPIGKITGWGLIGFVGLAVIKNWTVREALGYLAVAASMAGFAMSPPEDQARLLELLAAYEQRNRKSIDPPASS